MRPKKVSPAPATSTSISPGFFPSARWTNFCSRRDSGWRASSHHRDGLAAVGADLGGRFLARVNRRASGPPRKPAIAQFGGGGGFRYRTMRRRAGSGAGGRDLAGRNRGASDLLHGDGAAERNPDAAGCTRTDRRPLVAADCAPNSSVSTTRASSIRASGRRRQKCAPLQKLRVWNRCRGVRNSWSSAPFVAMRYARHQQGVALAAVWCVELDVLDDEPGQGSDWRCRSAVGAGPTARYTERSTYTPANWSGFLPPILPRCQTGFVVVRYRRPPSGTKTP